MSEDVPGVVLRWSQLLTSGLDFFQTSDGTNSRTAGTSTNDEEEAKKYPESFLQLAAAHQATRDAFEAKINGNDPYNSYYELMRDTHETLRAANKDLAKAMYFAIQISHDNYKKLTKEAKKLYLLKLMTFGDDDTSDLSYIRDVIKLHQMMADALKGLRTGHLQFVVAHLMYKAISN